MVSLVAVLLIEGTACTRICVVFVSCHPLLKTFRIGPRADELTRVAPENVRSGCRRVAGANVYHACHWCLGVTGNRVLM